MSESGSIHWEAFHVSVFGRERTAVRFLWAERPSSLKGCDAIVLRIRPAGGLSIIGAYIIAGADGVPCPELPEMTYLIPGPATVATFFVLLDRPTGQGHGFEAFVSFVRAPKDGAPTEKLLEVDLSEAWPQSPHDLATEVGTLRRLHGTGGTPSARTAYRRRAMEVLAQSSEHRIEEIRTYLRAGGVAESLDPDMQPLCYASEIMELARLADEGNVGEVTAGLSSLPDTLRANADVIALVDHAAEIQANPDDLDRRYVQKALDARKSGKLENALEWAKKVRPGGKYGAEARMVHLESAADLIETALRRQDVLVAKDWLDKEGPAFEAEVGPDDPWLVSIRRAVVMGGRIQVHREEEIPVADFDEDDADDLPPFTLWSRMRSWFSKVT